MSKLENYLELKRKHERMRGLVDDWAFDYNIEKLKPLLDDGFEGNDLIEYFTVRLIDYIDNKNSFEQSCSESFVQSELNFDFVEYSSYTIKPRFKIFNSLFFLFGTVSILYIFLANTKLFSIRSFKAK